MVAHDRANLSEGVGGPQDPAVLFSAPDVLSDLEGLDLVYETAGPVRREVATPEGPREAIDVLVRAQRPV